MNITDRAVFLNHSDIRTAAQQVAELISIKIPTLKIKIYPVPRGGIPAAYEVKAMLAQTFNRISTVVVDTPEGANIIVDDLIDSGRTMEHMIKLYPEKTFYALFNKKVMEQGSRWIIFPWETAGEDHDTSAEDIPIRLLQYIGEDIKRGGLLETPKRFLKAWQHYTSGYTKKPEDILKVFEDGAENYDEMVLVRDIPVYSHCEHHLAPFFGVAHVAYIPDGSIVGLSKLSRLVDIYARRLQVQERLTNQIASALETNLKPKGVAVVINCRHMCMESRGIQQQGSSTITSAMRGVMRDDSKARSEFMELIK